MIKIQQKCQIANTRDLNSIIKLGDFVPVNNFQKNKKKSIRQKKYPLELVFSNKSKLIQINCILPKELIFPKEYPYTSSTTKILRDNFVDLSKKIKKKINLNKNDIVMDIGCNDGNLLRNFLKSSTTVGISPEDVIKNAKKIGINTIQSYFDKKTVNKILTKYGKAKVITATNVFAHIDKTNELTMNIKTCLDDKGIFVTECHYAGSVIKGMQYDTIYHEHLRYYSLTSLNFVLKKHNLKVFDYEMINTHGGSIRVYCCHKNNNEFRINQKKIYKILNQENKTLNVKNFKAFNKKVLQNKDEISKLLKQLSLNKKKVYGVGAPSRASTLISYCSLNNKLIQKILEISGSYKINKYMPGTDIKVINETEGLKDNPDYLFLFSWHITKELIKNLKKKGFKGKFIVPLPKLKILK